MVIDASALVAILLKEHGSERFLDVLDAQAAPVLISPVSVYESVAAIVRVLRCPVTDARIAVRDALLSYKIIQADITAETSDAAITAFERYGKGRHPAALNMGDCFSYALARTLRLPLLFKGDDFSQTDIVAA